MLDRWSVHWVKKPLERLAEPLAARGVKADQITLVGFFIGLLAMVALAFKGYLWAFAFIVLNRIADGLDGIVARKEGPTDAGGFLDIVLDFIFYSSVVVGFAFADPARNALAAVVLIFSFMGTGASFLAFASLAAKRGITSSVHKKKSLYYLDGLTEGTETILFFGVATLFPHGFPVLALLFAIACGITTVTRIVSGYQTLKSD
ncbi:MAG: CDP-alcohol phosphatidyltransferase family protein [Desulfobacterales bacterium]|nr:CDP-alcohol phosphatidyltransferase family protein [Desulfobacterales bacterium]